jgi:hypothetical protein
VRSVVKGAFPRREKDEDDDAATVLRRPLLDSTEFALRVARGLRDGVAPRIESPYRGLSPRLRATPEVALAFVRLHSTNILYVPLDLPGNGGICWKLWVAATTHCGGSISNIDTRSSNIDTRSRPNDNSSTGSGARSTSPGADSCSKRRTTKGLVLRLLEESTSKEWPEGDLNDFAQVFPCLDPAIQQDQDVNLHMAAACFVAPLTALRDRLAPEWIHSREFWIDLAEKHHRQHALWTLVPAPEAVAAEPPSFSRGPGTPGRDAAAVTVSDGSQTSLPSFPTLPSWRTVRSC